MPCRPPAALVAAAGVLALAPAAVRTASACAPAGTLEVPALGSHEEELARVAEITGAVEGRSRLLRRGGDHEETVCGDDAFPWPGIVRPSPPDEPAESGGSSADAPERENSSSAASRTRVLRVRPLPLRLTSVWSSTYPVGDNDGLLWAGRGLSQEVSAGIALRHGSLSAALAPAVAWSENRAFELAPSGGEGDLRFGNPYYSREIDLPQRFGVGPFAKASLGQSYLRADRWNVGVGRWRVRATFARPEDRDAGHALSSCLSTRRR